MGLNDWDDIIIIAHPVVAAGIVSSSAAALATEGGMPPDSAEAVCRLRHAGRERQPVPLRRRQQGHHVDVGLRRKRLIFGMGDFASTYASQSGNQALFGTTLARTAGASSRRSAMGPAR